MEIAILALSLLTIGTVGLALLSRRSAQRAAGEVRALEARDLLTGLPKREAFLSALEEATRSAPSATNPVTVMMLELNRFAAINETYGHEIGDALLRAVAEKLRQALDPEERLFRYGGPQFALVGTQVRSLDHAQRRAAELLRCFDVPVRLRTDNIRVSASVGIVLLDRVPDTATEIVDDANAALRQAIKEGPNRITVFEFALRGDMSPATAERRLRQAFEREEFWLFYQPVIEIATNRLVGVESLLRWADPDHGVSAPARFLEALEDSGLIVPVGEWALRTACTQAAEWARRYPDAAITTTVNVSPRQLFHSEFASQLAEAVDASGIRPDAICLEIAGGATHYDVDGIWGTLRSIKQVGVQLALDDFGVGHASLDYVRRFHIDVLKIERAFVAELTKSREDLAIVQQLVGLGQALGITTVAEGVDSREQAEALISLDCPFAQGYYWSEPQPADVVERWIQRGRVVPGDQTTKTSVDWTASG